MKVLEYIKEKRLIHYTIIFIVSLLVSLPFLKISLLGTGDTRLHLLRIIGLRNSIANSNFPYIIAPFYCNNFGYATNLFYPQLVTYIPYFLKIFTSSYETAMELFAFITIFLSGIFMYNFTEQVTKNKIISVISSIIYITFPYRFENIYERFAIGEFTALVFIPILFQGLYNLIKQDRSKHYLIAVGTIGMLLSHSITTVYAAVFCVLYILFNIKDFFKKEVIKLCFINIILILMTTALFTVPLLEHKLATDYTIFDAEAMRGTGVDVYDNSASLKQLLTDSGSSKTVSFVIGTPIILYLLLSIFAYKKLEKEDKKWYGDFAILAFISLYMVTKLFPWTIMPNALTMVQFSWRILVFFNLFVAPICAINIYTIARNIKSRKLATIFVFICAIILIIFTSIRFSEYIEEKTESGKQYEDYEERVIANPGISHMRINREYLPAKTEKDGYAYLKNREDRVYVLSGKCSIINEEKQALNMSFNIEETENANLELPFLYYLGYDIKINDNGNIEKLDYEESDNGFVSIHIPENIKSSQITVTYTGTLLEKLSYAISALGLLGLIAVIWKELRFGDGVKNTS